MSIVDTMRFWVPTRCRSSCRRKYRGGDGDGVVSAETNDAHGPLGGGSSDDGNYGVRVARLLGVSRGRMVGGGGGGGRG